MKRILLCLFMAVASISGFAEDYDEAWMLVTEGGGVRYLLFTDTERYDENSWIAYIAQHVPDGEDYDEAYEVWLIADNCKQYARVSMTLCKGGESLGTRDYEPEWKFALPFTNAYEVLKAFKEDVMPKKAKGKH